MSNLARILLPYYHHMPPLMRDIVASARGYQMKRERYSAQAEAMVEEILERDHWSAQQWKVWQENRLSYVLHRAVTKVPFYRDHWAVRRRKGDHSSWEDLNNWQIVSKADIRSAAESFVAEDQEIRRMIPDRTGGTTGTPLRIWLSLETQHWYYAYLEARARRWNGVSRYENWATLGGQLIVSAETSHPPYWAHNYPMKQIYFSTGHISRASTPDYIRALVKHETTHMIAYTASATYLARQAIELGIEPPPKFRLMICNAEGLFPWQREIIEQGLGCIAIQTYGMVELAGCGSEKNGSFYQWPELGIIEVFQDNLDESAHDGESGRFICTGLLNADMPLIRYDVGDRGGVADPPADAQEMAYPLLTSVEGRQTEMLLTREGRRVWYFNPLFSGLPILEAQIIQDSLDAVRILYVPASGFTDAVKETITKRLHQRMGNIRAQFEEVESVPRESNGKFKLVVNNVPIEVRQQLGDVSV